MPVLECRGSDTDDPVSALKRQHFNLRIHKFKKIALSVVATLLKALLLEPRRSGGARPGGPRHQLQQVHRGHRQQARGQRDGRGHRGRQDQRQRVQLLRGDQEDDEERRRQRHRPPGDRLQPGAQVRVVNVENAELAWGHPACETFTIFIFAKF